MAEAGAETTAGRRPALAALALVAALLAAYLFADLRGPFLFDDRTAIVENRSLEPGAPPRELLWPERDISSSGRPLANLSFALDRRLFGLDPAAFRRTNALLFALTAVLALVLARRTLGSSACPESVRARALPLAFAACLVWGLHPMLSELVFYPTQRTEILAALCVLGCVLAATRAADAPGGRSARWTAAAGLAALLGVLAKESAVVAPILVVLWDLVFLEGTPRAILRRRRAVHLAVLASWIPLSLVLVATPRASSVGFHLGRDYGDWLRAQCVALAGYVEKAVWPAALVVDHGSLRQVAWSAAWPGALLALALVASALWLLLRRRPAGFALAWALVSLAPSSSFVPIVTEIAAERRMTLPLFALVTLAVAALWRALARVPRAGALALVALALVALLEARAIGVRAREYRTTESIWTTVVERAPQNPRGHFNLGHELAARGRLAEAISCYEEALRLRPDYAEAHDNLGVALGMLGRADEGLPHEREAVRLAPEDARARSNLGLSLLALGRAELALRRFDEALALEPGFAEAHQNRGLALSALGREEAGERELRRALELDPALDVARFNLAARLARTGRGAEAVSVLTPLVERRPADLEAAALLVQLLLAAGRAPEVEARARASVNALAALDRRAEARAFALEIAQAARQAGRPELAAALDALAGGL